MKNWFRWLRQKLFPASRTPPEWEFYLQIVDEPYEKGQYDCSNKAGDYAMHLLYTGAADRVFFGTYEEGPGRLHAILEIVRAPGLSLFVDCTVRRWSESLADLVGGAFVDWLEAKPGNMYVEWQGKYYWMGKDGPRPVEHRSDWNIST